MISQADFHPVLHWRSKLGPSVCPYQNPFAPARWFFLLRLREAIRAARSSYSGHALEIGCWEGFFLPTLLLNYSRVTAVDNDSCSLVERTPEWWTTLQAARELCLQERGNLHGLSLLKASGTELPFQDGSFDAVFCLDTLPFVPSIQRLTLINEMRRVLRPGCPAIFTLPIELGAGLLLREVLRTILGTWRDKYTLVELVRALFGNPAQIAMRSGRTSLIGYDYRSDEHLIRAKFALKKRKFLPSNSFRWISPTVLLCCRAEK